MAATEHVNDEPTHPKKVLPVTLLSVFLGSGRTTLLQHLLRRNHGLRIAVVLNDIGAIDGDASLICNTHRLTKTQAKLVRLLELATFDYVIVESSGISEPEQVAETFDKRLADQIAAMGEGRDGLDKSILATLKRAKDVGALDKFTRLEITCTVIDLFTMFLDFETTDVLSFRRDDVTAEDERTVSDLMVDQIEFADVIVMNNVDVDAKTLSRFIDLVTKMNHRANVLQSSYGIIDVKAILNTGMFDVERTQMGYGYNVRSFVYVRHRRFHSQRLFALLHDKSILQHPLVKVDDEKDGPEAEGEDDEMGDWVEVDDEEDDDEDKAASSSATSICPVNDVEMKKDPLDVPEAAGEYWLANRPDRAGEWSRAGAMPTLAGGRPWFCTISRSEWESGNADIDMPCAIEAVLDEYLLNDEEWAEWQKGMNKSIHMFDDGVPDWDEPEGDAHNHSEHTHPH
ncbi:hypothetical protein BAUCODRAFT_573912 [Baudoinia panamericana UAMH 10762]|uniref:CobW C-terminal domain-containing protein n=1 Tax=Baudoinia panamericana (strain UAMH 10762) TaxID=717646 RepID=M2NFV0_BAUPA|nr:uncharacterized protein BAUCODRAFT_573912 [Baudoinia panamericana UAMH 10762]EMC97875.1 hypothetical protein BAUCODRAFT_573912 [Baudoinia panamericana UAMH 10762]